MPDPELGVQADWELCQYGELEQEDRHVEAMCDLDEDRRHERERQMWLSDLAEEPVRLVVDDVRMLEPFHPDCEEAA